MKTPDMTLSFGSPRHPLNGSLDKPDNPVWLLVASESGLVQMPDKCLALFSFVCLSFVWYFERKARQNQTTVLEANSFGSAKCPSADCQTNVWPCSASFVWVLSGFLNLRPDKIQTDPDRCLAS